MRSKRSTTVLLSLMSGLLLNSLMLVGCNNEPEDVATAVVPEQAETNAPVPPAPYDQSTAAPLGTEQTAGPFQVVLTTEPHPPKVGDNSFTLKVTKDGQAVNGAQVNINFVDPVKNATADTFQLTQIGDTYSAAQNINTTDPVHAVVTVTSGNDNGRAVYVLNSAGQGAAPPGPTPATTGQAPATTGQAPATTAP